MDRNSPQPEVMVVEGGERLYVFPAANVKYWRAWRVFYLRDTEQHPYPNDNIITIERAVEWTQLSLLWRLYYVVFKRIFVAFGRMIEDARNTGSLMHLFDARLFGTYYCHAVPFVGIDYPNLRLGIPFQLVIVDNSGCSEDFYLNPSQEWIANKVEEWLLDKSEYEYEDEDKAAFTEWRKRMIEQEHEIFFLVSMDT